MAKNAWTGGHDAWLRRLRADTSWSTGTRSAFDNGYETVVAAAARRDRLDAEIAEMAVNSEFTPIVRRLGCLCGISTLTAFALAVEMGDWTRFSGASIGAFVGLTLRALLRQLAQPRIDHLDRQLPCPPVLVEVARHHRSGYRPGRPCTTAGRWPPPTTHDVGITT